MTFDRRIRTRNTDLRLDLTDEADQYLDDDLTLLEVKAGGAIPLWLVKFFSAEGIRKVSFSKVGMAWQRVMESDLIQLRTPELAEGVWDRRRRVVGIPATCAAVA